MYFKGAPYCNLITWFTLKAEFPLSFFIKSKILHSSSRCVLCSSHLFVQRGKEQISVEFECHLLYYLRKRCPPSLENQEPKIAHSITRVCSAMHLICAALYWSHCNADTKEHSGISDLGLSTMATGQGSWSSFSPELH